MDLIQSFMGGFFHLYYFQVRYKFGCIDEIQEVEEREVRHCNWVRFVQSTRCIDDVNIVAIKVREHTVYQVIKRLNFRKKLFQIIQSIQIGYKIPVSDN